MIEGGNGLGAFVVVDDRAPNLDFVRSELADQGFSAIKMASSWDAAHVALSEGCSVLLVEALFADGTDCRDLVYTALRLPTPPEVIIMSQCADRRLIAELAFAGASAYLEKPLRSSELRACVARVTDHLTLCKRVARLLVGRVGLKEAQWYLRGTMNREALDRTGGSFRAAASILRVDRRYVARLADEFRASSFASSDEPGQR